MLILLELDICIYGEDSMKKKIGLLAAVSLGVFAGYKLYKKNNVSNNDSYKSINENVNVENSKQNDHYVLVTGASTGIGKSISEMLAKQNYKVFSTVRNEQDAEKLAKISNNITPIIMDVADHDSILRAKDEVKELLGANKLFSIINNAGIVVAGPLEILPIANLKRQFDVNVFGLIDTIQVFFDLLDHNNSKIINMSSIGGRIAFPFIGPYAASKHALEALSDSMRRELLNTGIDVVVIQPGSIKTPIWGKSEGVEEAYKNTKYYSLMTKFKKMTLDMGQKGAESEKVGETVLNILKRKKNKSRYIVSKNLVGEVYATRYLPDRLFDKVIKATMYK